MSINIRYIGNKDVQEDHLYGTGIVWTGKGDVRPVPEDKAPFLLQHTDVWKDARSASARKKTPIAATEEVPLRYRETDELLPEPVKVHLMPLEDLARYAFSAFGERLAPELNVEQARAEVTHMMRTRR